MTEYTYRFDVDEVYRAPVHSFKWGTWVFLSVFIEHRSFTQGIQQSAEDSYPYIGRRRRRGGGQVRDSGKGSAGNVATGLGF